ncbi:MAG: MOSC domain-containing protein [Chloroflexi bacterium]|nr:MOSC domain-containing protein [Chloroflexota bacterium]
MSSEAPVVGSVASLWRYPVKSMMGEELNSSYVTQRGLLGDRVYALVDSGDGKVVSAKNPRKWAKMFEFRAAFVQPPVPDRLPPVRITLPDGSTLTTDEAGIEKTLAGVLGRPVALAATPPEAPQLEEYWPDVEGLIHRETVTDERMPQGTFFDLGIIHLLTTGTIDRLREAYPQGRFEARRFRPNIVVETPGQMDFVENAWLNQTLAVGEEVRLRVFSPCPRCVMTTLPQDDLPQDYGILRASAQHNKANVGVYAMVLQQGVIRRGDRVKLQ